MEIYFLTPEQSYPRLQNLHINTGCTKAHTGSIISFNSEQKMLLLHLMKQLENLLSPYSSRISKIEFVLLNSGVYWDFPFTWGKSMIMITPNIFAKPRKIIKKILAHEWVHLDQRRNPKKDKRFYKSLGFRRKHIDFGALTPYLLRNPDADTYEWTWKSPDGGPTYAPVALLKSCEFNTVLLEMNGTIHRIEDVPAYYERFGVKKQLYHPNEIAAHLIADMLVDKINYVQVNLDMLLH